MVIYRVALRAVVDQKMTLEAIVRKDLFLLDITEQDGLDRAQWTKQIHIANPN